MAATISHPASDIPRTRGVALLMVLLIVLAITIIATGFIAKADVELACGQNMLLRTEMDHLADSALEHARGLLLHPQGISETYWTGASGLQLVNGSCDYYDVTVTRDSTDYCDYAIDCEAYRLRNGSRVGSCALTGAIRLDPCIGLWTLADTTLRQNWVLHGDMRTQGTVVNQAVKASLDGDVFATSLSGNGSVGQVGAYASASPDWPPVTGTYVNSSYTTTSLSSTLSTGSTLTRIWRRDGDLTLGSNVSLNGMLLVTGNLTIVGGRTRITAAKNLPALYVGGNLLLEDASDTVITGLTVVGGNLQLRASATGVKFIGGLCLGGAVVETTADASGNGMTGTLAGNPVWQNAGTIGGALRLDGTGDYVDCGDNALLDLTAGVTVAAWVKTERAGFAVNESLVTKGSHAYSLAINADIIEFAVYSDSTATWAVAQYPITSAFNAIWHHVAGTFDGAALKLYVDGTLQSTVAYAGLIASNPTHKVLIGANCEDLSRLYQGSVDDVCIYDVALDATMISSVMAGTSLTGLLGRWRLDGPGSYVTIQADPLAASIVAWPDGASNPAVTWSPAADAFFRNIQRQLP